MKNFLTKAFVCAGVVASALALSSITAFAATYTAPTSGDIDAGTTLLNDTENGMTIKSTVALKGSSNGIAQSKSTNDAMITAGEKTYTTRSFVEITTTKQFIITLTLKQNLSNSKYFMVGNGEYVAYDSTSDTTKAATTMTGTATPGSGTSTVSATLNAGTYVLGFNGTDTAIKSIDYVDSSVTHYSVEMESTVPANYPTASATLDSLTSPTEATVTWSANDNYLAGSVVVTLTDDMLNGTTYTIPYSAIASFLQENETAQVITTYTSLATQNISNGDYTNGQLLGDYFKLVVQDTSKNLTVEDNTKTYGNDDVSFSQRFKTNGNNRNIEFSVKEDSLVQVYFVSGKANTERSITLGDVTVSNSSDSNIKVLTTTVKPSDTINGSKFTVVPNAAVNIYDIRVTPGVTYNTKTNGSTVVTSTDTYVLANVSEETVTASGKNKLTLTITNPSTSSKPAQTVETDSVYKYVRIGNAYFEGNKYIFGVKITGANGKDIASGVTFSVS